ncbi:hypothetical protein [Dyella sp. SG609]|uniref:hypothetical protein n=1 Tax=Dyella sp. SG609 TaxID=2587018 RepID=UPI0014470A57|nr:hypothetical protein [Dyella sp. SG609]NKJ21984.1 hypothetical protein [Dyella sp. SG609]
MPTVNFYAELIGDSFRGEAVNAETYETVFRTPGTYPDPQMAQMAAQRMYAARINAAMAREYADAHRGAVA